MCVVLPTEAKRASGFLEQDSQAIVSPLMCALGPLLEQYMIVAKELSLWCPRPPYFVLREV